VSRKRGRPSNHQLAPGVAERETALIRERYADFGPTLACEKLGECHALPLAKETVRVLMMAAGLWTPRKQRAAQIHQPRNRRACVGELIQIDSSDHDWFEARAPRCTLLVFIGDATSRLMQLHFVPTESSFAYFEATRGYILCANSSQAKGRVERANLTQQDRLVKELRLREITGGSDLAQALHFIVECNARFANPTSRASGRYTCSSCAACSRPPVSCIAAAYGTRRAGSGVAAGRP
jgi:hypothetical protein